MNGALRSGTVGVRLVHTAAVALIALASACHRLPLWRGVVEVAPISRPAIDRCGTGDLSPLGRQRIWRHAYLQSVTARSALVAAGVRGSLDDLRVLVTSTDGAVVTSAPLRSAPGSLAVAKLETLEPGTIYCYRLVGARGPLNEPAPLTTAAPPGTPFQFVALGDSGTGSDAQLAIRARLGAVPFEFALFLGDIAYTDGTADQIERHFFTVYRKMLRWAPAFTAIGNHERHTDRGAPYFEALFLPGRERYYSFDWGDIHFVALDTTQVGKSQLLWLDRDLAKNRLPWVIAFAHHPLLSNSLRGPRTILRRRLLPILRRHRVDLILAGHEHHYERFHPIAGLTSIVSGGGGGRLTRTFDRAATASQAAVHHFLHFEASARRIDMRAISIDGTVIDRLTLRRAAR